MAARLFRGDKAPAETGSLVRRIVARFLDEHPAGRVTDMQMMQTPRRAPETTLQKVVVVNGSPEILEMLETVLDAGRYDMVFVESSARAYSRVRHVQPDLVIVCMRIDDVEVFQLLSMLKLDAETRRIPVVTYTTHLEADNDEPEDDDVIDEDEFPITRPTMPMN
jgi:PleD family two-component response regulator